MASAKIRYLQKIYENKYGALGKVAGRYLGAGYSIEFNHPTRYGPISIVVRGKGSVIVIDVVEKSGYVDIETIKALIEKAKVLKARPILVLYSEAPKLSDDVRKLCIDNGIKIRRIRR